MFNLDQAVAEWRRQMLASGIKSPVPLEELESHLREDVDLQVRSGASPEQAFERALQSIGNPAALKNEFTKATTTKWTRLQRLKGALLRWIGGPHPCADALTDGAREILEIGRKEALGFHHDFIGTEHLLLGLLESKTGVVPGVLHRMGVDHTIVRGEIERIVGNGPEQPGGHSLSYTPRVKKALQLAGTEAKAMNQTQVGGEHLFLGLLLEGSGVAALVLRTLGVNIQTARGEIRRELSRNQRGT